MKFNILIILTLSFQLIQAQQEAANWFFGEYAGVNFNSGTPEAQKGELTTREGCASISDSNGNLLFYTDGTSVYSRDHEIMPNGEELLGNNSSTQSAIIVPKPGSLSNYYIFTVDNAEKASATSISYGLNYSEVDMNLNNGFGDVLLENKNTHLLTYDPGDAIQADWKCSEKVAAILNRQEDGYWVVTHFLDSFYAFRVDQNGVGQEPVKSSTDEMIPVVDVQLPGSALANISAIGYLKISPNGKKLAIVHSSTANSRTSGRAYLYDFDDETGIISNNAVQLIGSTYPYGIEFSSKSNKLYLSTNNYVTQRGQTTFTGSSLYQYDLRSDNIATSRTEVHSSFSLLAGALQLAIDGKIYRANYDQSSGAGLSSLGVIDKPELDGIECGYKDQGVTLLANTYSQYGLPPFIASSFLLSFLCEFTCFNDLSHFMITSQEEFDSVIWDFGDGHSSTETEAWHTYEAQGTYTVTLVTIQDGVQGDPVKKTIEITEPLPVPPEPIELYECDLFDQDPDDGLTTFNLSLANAQVSMGAENTIVHYYDNLDLLHQDRRNTEALPELYANTEPDALVFGKVSRLNSDCYSVARLILKTNPSGQFQASPLSSCDDGQGMAIFALGDHRQVLAAELGLPMNADISFHSNKEEAALGRNPLEEAHHGYAGTIFFRIDSEQRCYGVGELPLDIYELPGINKKNDFTFCAESFPARIDAGVSQISRNLYGYLWQGGQETHEISISEPGVYQVTISDLSSSCSMTKVIEVNSIAIPVIEDVVIKEEFDVYSAEIKVAGTTGQPLYSLNEEFGRYQEEGFFENLNPGTYTVYVKDPFNCRTVSRQFHLFGFPKFITPNHDGQNDVWNVQGINKTEFTYSKIHIFNRYGKLLATLDPEDHWDGTYMGVAMPSDDYWYTMTVTDAKNNTSTYSGHFSLIRK